MARLTSVGRVLQDLQQSASWRKTRQFLRVLEVWPQCVGEKLCRYCQPQRLSEGMLWVATQDGMWAQQLSYERETIRRKLLDLCPDLKLKEIRFSPNGWNTRGAVLTPAQTPVPVPAQTGRFNHPPTKDPAERMAQVGEVVRWRQSQWPVCPACRCPTHPASLKRWSKCASCHIKP